MSYDVGVAHLLPIAIAVPIVVAALLVAIGEHVPRPVVDVIAILTSGTIAGLAARIVVATTHGRVVSWAGGWKPVHRFSVGIALEADQVGAGLAVLAAALMMLALLYGWRFFESVHAHFHALMVLFLAGMEGFALTGDIFDMFVFFELMGAVAYALTGFKIEDASALQGALNFGIINSLGAYLSLTGVAILYARTGQLGLAELAQTLDPKGTDALVVLAFVLVVAGFLVKGALAPFHFWLADAHAVAPTPVCVLFSGVMVELGLYATARVYWVVFSGTLPHHVVEQAFVVMGTITAVVGAIMCFSQRHLKRLLAYSTIAHVGLFTIAFAMLDDGGTAGAALYVLGHAGAKSALFLMAGIVLNRYGSVDEVELFGRGRDARVMPWLFVVGGIALAGCPPFGTGLGKDIAEAATIKAGYFWEPGIFVAVSGVTAAAVLRAGCRIYFGLGDHPSELAEGAATKGEEEPEVDSTLARVPWQMVTAVAVLLLGCLAIGLVPGFAERVGQASHQFIDRHGYVEQAVAYAPSVPVPHVPEMHWSFLGLMLGASSGALALVVAAAALYRQRIPMALRLVARQLGTPLLVVRRVHSGHIGDYVAWLFAGLAALGALVGIPLR